MEIETSIKKNKEQLSLVIYALLSITGGLSISRYLYNSFPNKSSFCLFSLLFVAMLFYLWTKMPRNEGRLFYLVSSTYAVVFSFFMVYGQILDFGGHEDTNTIIILGIGVSTAMIPITIMSFILFERFFNTRVSKNNFFPVASFAIVVLCWLLGYLAAFPGIYSTDAMAWYLEFSDPSVPISSQWSPAYAGVFYLFISFGEKFFGTAELGMALFSAAQASFLLIVIWNIIKYTYELGGNRAVILTGAFFALVPTHFIMSIQTAQGAPFMGCFSIVLIHLCKMTQTPDAYWKNKSNIISFMLWGTAACILRNNAFFAFALLLLLIPLYKKGYRKKMLLLFIVLLVTILMYKGPVLDSFDIKKGTALREMMSMPLQQMACVYVEYPDSMTEKQKNELEQYINKGIIETYAIFPSNADALKKDLDLVLVKRNVLHFINLYYSIGKTAPKGFVKAAYMQTLGLLYIDKSYPDPRMWHHFLNYASYDLEDEKYIKIRRQSLFPQYDKLLFKMFGYSKNGGGGNAETIFDEIPLISTLCRASTYFWFLLFLAVFGITRKQRDFILPVGLMICFTITVILGPVIIYRYYAPVVFAMPVLVSYISNVIRVSNNISSKKMI